MLLLFDLVVLLSENVNLLEYADFLLRQEFDSVLSRHQLRTILLVLYLRRLAFISHGSNLNLNLLCVLVHTIDVLLCFGISLPLPFDLILDHLALLLCDLVVAERVLQPSHLELGVIKPAPEAVSLLVYPGPLLLDHVEPPPQGLDIDVDC